MNFGQAFSYPFQDPDWLKKILVPALIFIIPILGQVFLIGWALDVTRRVIRQDPTPLPELDFGRQFVDGLKAFVVGLVYSLPAIILSIPVVAVSIGTTSTDMDPDTANSLIALVSVCCNGLIALYSLFLGFVLPAAYGNMVAKEDLGAAFRFPEVFGLVRANPGAYLVVLAGALVSGLIGSLGVIACFIGVFATYAYAMAVNGHLYGQAYNEATGRSGFAKAY
jgi:hypothetical protein